MAESTVELVLDDSAAVRSVEALVQKLKAAQDSAAAVFGVQRTQAASAKADRERAAETSQRAAAAKDRASSLSEGSALFSQAGGLFGGGAGSGLSMFSRAAARGANALRQSYVKQAAQQAAQQAAGGAEGAGGLAGLLGGGAAGGAALAGSAALGAVAGYAAVAAIGMQQRYSMLGRGAALERQAELAGRTGGANLGLSSSAMRGAAALGFGPDEAAGTLSGYYQQIGIRGSANFTMSPFAAMLEGISPGALAAYQRGPSLGAVASNAGSLSQALGLARMQGLSGSQVEDLLGRIATASDQMVGQGLTLDRGSLLSLAASLGAASPAFSGGRGVAAGAQLSQMGLGAARGFASSFGGLADAAIQSEAFSGARSPMEAIAQMERLASDPRKVREALIRQLGPEAAELALTGRGFGTQQARALAGDLPEVAIAPSEGAGQAGILSRAQAETDRRLLETGLAQPQTQVAMLETMTALQGTSMRMSEQLDALIQLVGSAAARYSR